MNRFEPGVDQPRSRRVPAWDDRAHVTPSKNNHFYHTQYKEYFDKRHGQPQYRDHIKYIYKTPSNGIRDHSYFEKRAKYYWERRQPVDPQSPVRRVMESVETSFQGNFHVMFSKHNEKIPKAEREYFDRPVGYLTQGYRFMPVHKRPIELRGDLRTSLKSAGMNSLDQPYHNNNNNNNNSFQKYSTFTSSFMENPVTPPVTTGLNNDQFFVNVFKQPKELAHKGGELSIDYGIIPNLRTSDKYFKKRARSIVRSRMN
mmetsp:Transcript_1196/g.2186  ORF Transcript_1196/g.2186 Transcript_1196/m.2186 type:complete len:257 (+) Transcript_1196:45-815(+)